MLSLARARTLIRSAFWVVPAACVLAAIALGVGMLALDQHLGRTRAVFLFPGTASGARTFLSAIIQAMITFTGLVFSITIVVLQLTSSQFSPRVLRTFVRDRTIQLALGTFLATFVYGMVVLRAVGGTGTPAPVPRAAVTGCFVLVLVSVGMFIRYVTHITSMIRAASIIETLGKETRHGPMARLLEEAEEGERGEVVLGSRLGCLCAPRAGVVVALNAEAIVAQARHQHVQVTMVPQIGDFVPDGAELLRTYRAPGEPERDVDADALLRHIVLDNERTLDQDLAFGLRQLVDIAQRALSPGINDPTTAVQAIDVIHDLLRHVAPVKLAPSTHFDGDGVLRLAVPRTSLSGYLGLAVGQIWHYGSDSAQVPQRLAGMLTDLLTVARPEHRPDIRRWLDVVAPAAREDPTTGTMVTIAEPGAGDARGSPAVPAPAAAGGRKGESTTG